MRLTVNGRRPGKPEWWCPECGERARYGRPTRWTPVWGARPPHSHLDGTPLCPVMTEHGYRPAPATSEPPGPTRKGSDTPPLPATWYARTMAKAASDLHNALQGGQPVDLAPVSLAVSNTLRTVEKVGRHMEVAALTADPSVVLQVIRAGALAEYASLAYAEVNMAVLIAGHADQKRRRDREQEA